MGLLNYLQTKQPWNRLELEIEKEIGFSGNESFTNFQGGNCRNPQSSNNLHESEIALALWKDDVLRFLKKKKNFTNVTIWMYM